MMQCLEPACFVDMGIGNHTKQLLCYMAKLDVYAVILRDGWLQIHNSMIDWKDQIMQFN